MACGRLFFLTQHKVKAVTFRGRVFVPVTPPRVLQRKRLSHTLVVEVERRGLRCRVTSLERTAVDALDRPDLTGGLDEAWRSVSAIPLLDLRAVLDYVCTTACAPCSTVCAPLWLLKSVAV
jgi:predicted transcriptional regulator of viral defense system